MRTLIATAFALALSAGAYAGERHHHGTCNALENPGCVPPITDTPSYVPPMPQDENDTPPPYVPPAQTTISVNEVYCTSWSSEPFACTAWKQVP